MDTQPRTFSPENCVLLGNMAELVVKEMEKEVALQKVCAENEVLNQENAQLLRTIDCSRCLWL